MSEAIQIAAAVLHEPDQPLDVRDDVTLDPPRAGEVRVAVAASGVCHSDLHLAEGKLGRGRWPIVLGHEGAGVVESVGDGVTSVKAGDHVCFAMIPSCGRCPECQRGRFNLCVPAGEALVKGSLLDGTRRLRLPSGEELQHGLCVGCFASHVVVAEQGALPIPDDVPLWQAALAGCGVVTGFGAVRNVGQVRLGDRVAVVGCGGVGLQVITAARMAGAARIVAVDRSAAKSEAALAFGATHAVVADGSEKHAVRALTDGGADVAFEVVGLPQTIRAAWDMTRDGGRVVVVGVAEKGAEVSVPALAFLGDKSIAGCYYGSGNVAVDLPRYVQMARDGRLDLGAAVSHVSDLAGIDEAFARMRAGEGARTVVILDEAAAGRGPG